MIAELFYPKELKKIIRDLEAEGNLHREPLVELNKELRLMLFMACISTFITYFNGTVIDFFFFSLFFIGAIFIFMRTKIEKLKVYIYGARKEGTVNQLKYAYFRNTIIRVSRLSDGASLKLNRVDLLVRAEHGVQVGGNIFFYEIEGSSVLPMPDIYIVKKYYCLRKDLIGDNNYA